MGERTGSGRVVIVTKERLTPKMIAQLAADHPGQSVAIERPVTGERLQVVNERVAATQKAQE